MRPQVNIVARNNAQATYYAEELGLNPTQWRYVPSPEYLRGLDGGVIYFVGPWYERSDAREMEERAVTARMEIHHE